MDPDLAQRLRDLNRRFYLESADSFVSRRRRPWAGWHRLLAVLREQGLTEQASVLDVGCGHGRFGLFLADQGQRGQYVGVDLSLALLLRATQGVRRRGSLLAGDLISAIAPQARFDLVVASGLLHHVPGAEARTELLRRLGAYVASSGQLAVTLWCPDERRRARAMPVPGGEAGDVLLPWGNSNEAGQRYCHFFDDREVEALELAFGDAALAFQEDGRGGENHYLIGAGLTETSAGIE